MCVHVVSEHVHSLEHRRMTGIGLSTLHTSVFFVQATLEEGLIYGDYGQQIAIHSSCSFLLLMKKRPRPMSPTQQTTTSTLRQSEICNIPHKAVK